MDIDDPALFDEYFRMLYDLADTGKMSEGKAKELKDAIIRQHFVDVARKYRLITQDAVSVLVPYDLPAYERLAAEVRQTGLRADWMRRAQPYVVSLFRPEPDDAVWTRLEPAPLARRDVSEDWFIYSNEEDYDRELKGLAAPTGWTGDPV